mmetsp:Transcript_10765/g.27101  ORF Transcript_10765/g.27101 Transcript_10765/m.27101 type:complete len:99 (-) Transcript_10765:16-312(-)
MERKSEHDLAQMRARAEQEMTDKDRQFTRDVNRLRMQHESYAKEVEASQNSYNAVQQAADEIRAKLKANASQQGQQYQNLNDVQLDIKIDKKYRVRDI